MIMAAKPEPLEAGTKAPAFTATTYDDKKVKLTDYKGTKVALYFYPQDATPGCTKQACNLRDNTEALTAAGIAVIGVSPDDNTSHEKFATKHELPFPLIADPDHKVICKYGVWGEKQNYGKTYMGLQRTTFLIDEAGKIMHVFKRPKTSDHTAEILSKL
ncbi:MAG: peroxiredoxin Q/BCP [Acidimicrobiales bacterium]|jgi:peroxiredoxin Q/BCP